MRNMITMLLAVVMTMTGAMGVAAQDQESSYGSGIGEPAIWIDDRGNEVATVEVTDVVTGWDGYDENGAPARGYDFVAVSFSVTNISDAAIEVEPNRFSLVDSQGLNNSRAYVRVANPAEAGILEDSVSLDAGATQDATVVFELFSDVTPAMFVWQPENGILVMVNVGDGQAEESAVAVGLGVPATYADDRGNVVGSIEVREIEDDWQDHDEYSTADRGMRHVAIHFTVSNLSDAPLELNPFDVSLLDSESTNNGRSYVTAVETAEVQVTSDAVEIAPGESFDGMLVYTLFEGVEPTAVLWQPDFGSLTIVVVAEGDSDAGTDTEATPTDVDVDEDEAEATPAA